MAASECNKGAFGRLSFFFLLLSLSSSMYLVYKSMIAFFSKKKKTRAFWPRHVFTHINQHTHTHMCIPI